MTKKALILTLKNKLYCFSCVYCKDDSTIGTIGYKCQLYEKHVGFNFPVICEGVKLHETLEYGVSCD
jgi:hypothetical protein